MKIIKLGILVNVVYALKITNNDKTLQLFEKADTSKEEVINENIDLLIDKYESAEDQKKVDK